MRRKDSNLKYLLISISMLIVSILLRPLFIKLTGGEKIVVSIGFLVLPSILFNLFIFIEIIENKIWGVVVVTLAVLTSELMASNCLDLYVFVKLVIIIVGGIICAFAFSKKTNNKLG